MEKPYHMSSPNRLGRLFKRYRERNDTIEIDTGESESFKIYYEKFRYVSFKHNQFKWIIDGNIDRFYSTPITGMELETKNFTIRTNTTIDITTDDIIWLPLNGGMYFNIGDIVQQYGYFPKMRKTFLLLTLNQLDTTMIEVLVDEYESESSAE